MSQCIWHWFSGNSKFYTGKREVAEKAKKEGFSVLETKIKTSIIKYLYVILFYFIPEDI